MKTLTLEDVRTKFGELAEWLENGEEVILTKNGEERYVIHELDDFEREVASLSKNVEFRKYLRACQEEGERIGRVPLDEVIRLHEELLRQGK